MQIHPTAFPSMKATAVQARLWAVAGCTVSLGTHRRRPPVCMEVRIPVGVCSCNPFSRFKRTWSRSTDLSCQSCCEALFPTRLQSCSGEFGSSKLALSFGTRTSLVHWRMLCAVLRPNQRLQPRRRLRRAAGGRNCSTAEDLGLQTMQRRCGSRWSRKPSRQRAPKPRAARCRGGDWGILLVVGLHIELLHSKIVSAAKRLW